MYIYYVGHSDCELYEALQDLKFGQKTVLKHIPDGSFRCESVAKSSAVSNKGGFLRGGRFSFPSFISLPVVLIIIS